MVKNYNGETYIIPKEFEEEVRVDERIKAERDFQNSDYWNDYLAKVLADARADEREKTVCEIMHYIHNHTENETPKFWHFLFELKDNKEQK